MRESAFSMREQTNLYGIWPDKTVNELITLDESWLYIKEGREIRVGD